MQNFVKSTGLLCMIIPTVAYTSLAVAQAQQEGSPSTSKPPVQEQEAPDNAANQEIWWARLGFGGKLGPGLATFVGDFADREFIESTNKLGFTFGGFANFRLNRWSSLQIETAYAFKGNENESDGLLIDTWDIRYVEVPLLARITMPTSTRIEPYLLAGPVAGFLLSLEIEDADDGAISDRKDEARSIDMGLVLGLGANLEISPQHALVAEARYDRGLTSVDKTDMVNLENQVLSIMLGYQYSLSARSSPSLESASVP